MFVKQVYNKWRKLNVRTTYIAKPGEVERKWYVIDATDIPLGRLSTVVASILRGKNKPTFTPNVDTGDFVIVVNAEKVALTGKKDKNKIYYHHSNHPGGLKERTAGDYRANDPEKLIALSVKGMLPKGSLGRQQAKKLHVYRGENHDHAAQQPEVLDITNLI
ncbi:50S ribosomal protein L13 [Ligilactobacillus sp. WILCCON 0076]|uniref:Large ribosomal subunit protein uL13 n=1 Tax=Ligilactobacillus ubinensis TaxID=2876789 RepID=A0A9X2JLR1_9LACO|nr:50S ribosomal protein L13 [Ligilactobacillus ubinensis]MCP0886875.1 50S ribosomal protein L13 [Ligilactobacillus ubinensis]